MNRAVAIASSALLLSACNGMRTEVLLVIDSDLAVPEELDELRVDLIGPSGETRRSEGSVRSPDELPRTLGLVDETNSARTVRVTVTGLRGGANVIQRRAVFTFVPGETRILRIGLWKRCVGVSCASDETCGDSGCRPIAVLPEERLPYDPSSVTRSDAGAHVDSGTDGGCTIVEESCNGLDDDCDGTVDDGFDFASDMAHCGRCDSACPIDPANGSSVCAAGNCVLRCDPGFADCNTRVDDGCEVALSEPAHCGSCSYECPSEAPFCAAGAAGYECVSACASETIACSGSCVDTSSDPLRCGNCTTRCPDRPSSAPSCVGGVCSFECDIGYADCDGLADNGCESNLRELDNCGRCGQRCYGANALTSCTSGACDVVSCSWQYGDCDLDPFNGCEEDLSSNRERCGACDDACPASATNGSYACVAGRCQLSCAPGFGNCDTSFTNGCEQSLASASACGVCGVACTDPSPVCTALATGYACTDGCAEGTLCESSCVDTSSHPAHCGGCEQSCSMGTNAEAICTSSECSIRCASGFADCDGDGVGCEVDISGDVQHCGRCGYACIAPANTVASCSAGTCSFRCATGFADCNDTMADGCEVDTRSDSANCGACRNGCSISDFASEVACVEGGCAVVRCSPPYADCDRTFMNGCETDTSLNRNHCGACNSPCGGGQRCCGGQCRVGGCV